jgi:hypothetical protein
MEFGMWIGNPIENTFQVHSFFKITTDLELINRF